MELTPLEQTALAWIEGAVCALEHARKALALEDQTAAEKHPITAQYLALGD